MKRPNPFLYLPFAFLLYIFAFFKGQRIIRKIKINKPSIIIANHTSFYDFIYSTTALFPYRLTYVAVDKMYYTRPAGFFMRLARSIPKCLFQPDLRSTKNILDVLKKKGIVCIYPEGQISSFGKTLDIPYQIAKLVKVASVDLYICKHRGAYFSNPPWTKKSFRGRVESKVFKLIDQREIDQLSTETIFKVIKNGMNYDASEDNISKRWKYKISDISNFENVIYECPKCSHQGLKSQENKLICPKCNYEMVFNSYGLINQKTISHYYHRQEQNMLNEYQKDPTFHISSQVDLESYLGQKICVVGSGTLLLDRYGYHYKGTMFEKEVSLDFDCKYIPSTPSDIGINIQIYKDYRLYQFVVKEEKYKVMQFVIFGEILYKLANQPH